MPAPARSDAGTASQLIPGVGRTCGGAGGPSANKWASEALGNLVAYATEPTAAHLRNGDTPSPALITRNTAGARAVDKFVMFEGEEALNAARHRAASATPEVTHAVLVYCAATDIGQDRKPSIVFEAHQRGQPKGLILVWPFRPKGWLRSFRLLGDAVPVDDQAVPLLVG
jgi:hypothetical protein